MGRARVHRRARKNLMLQYGETPVAVVSSSQDDTHLPSEEEGPRPAKRACLESVWGVPEVPSCDARVNDLPESEPSAPSPVEYRPVSDDSARAIPAYAAAGLYDRSDSSSTPIAYRPAIPVKEGRAIDVPAYARPDSPSASVEYRPVNDERAIIPAYARSDSPSASVEFRPARSVNDERAILPVYARPDSPSASVEYRPPRPVSDEGAIDVPAYAVDLYGGSNHEKSTPAPPSAVGRVIEYVPAGPTSATDEEAEKEWEAMVPATTESSVPRPYTGAEERRVAKNLIPVYHSQLQRKLEVPVESVDEFLIIKKVGSGSFGAVSKAIRHSDRKEIALKKMRIGRREPETSDLLVNEELEKCIQREIELLFKCKDNENVARMEAMVSGVEGEFIMVAMDFYPSTLHEVIKSDAHAPDIYDLKIMMLGLCNGINFMHEHQIVHRDLKPANILVDREGTLKIADLGLARNNLDTAPMTPQRCTRVYRAPEVLLNYVYDDNRPMDMWSMGIIFVEIVDPHNGVPFYGRDNKKQAWSIFRGRGTPTETSWPRILDARADFFAEGDEHTEEDLTYRFDRVPKASPDDLYKLFCRLCTLDPRQRITAAAAREEFEHLEEDLSFFADEWRACVASVSWSGGWK